MRKYSNSKNNGIKKYALAHGFFLTHIHIKLISTSKIKTEFFIINI